VSLVRASLVLVCLSILVPASGQAVPLNEWGAYAQTSTSRCPSFCTDVEFGAISGGQGSTSGSSSINDSRGNAASLSQLDPSAGLSVPLLKAEAFSAGGQGGAQAFVYAAEGYTYTGAVAKEFVIDIMLTATVLEPGVDSDALVRAQVYVFEADTFEFFSDLGTLLFEVGAVPKASFESRIADPETNASRAGQLVFTLDPGEQVYLWANLLADAKRSGAVADAFSTLTNTFQDAGGLTAASVVPEPSTASLLALGLVGLAAKRRRVS
jgi:hypothetical protein